MVVKKSALLKRRRKRELANDLLIVSRADLILWVLIASLFAAVTGGGLGYWLMLPGGPDALSASESVSRLSEEAQRLKSLIGTEGSALDIERAAGRRLAERVRLLELENARSKEELLLMERLLAAPGESGRLKIEVFRLEAVASPRLTYDLALTYQPDRQGGDFKGKYRIVVRYELAGKERQILLPGDKDGAGAYVLEVRRFLRKSGELSLPDGAVLKGAELIVLQGDVVKARQYAR